MPLRLLLRWSPPALTAGCAALLILIAFNRPIYLPTIGTSELNAFTTLFLSVVLEALPFMLLGVIVSALLQVFVSEQAIRSLAPRSPFLGSVFGALLGLLFPLCECGMIPVVRRLIRKGMPAYIGIVYILAGPIVNPIVFASTYTAFHAQPGILYGRMGLGFLVAFLIGLVLSRYMKASPLRTGHSTPIHEHPHHGHHSSGQSERQPLGTRFASTLGHASEEFFDMGKYLIFGALLTALIQTGVDRSSLDAIASHETLSQLFMMAFAYFLSLCSTSDAFVAASFSHLFTAGPLLAFLVFGPMIDLKNTLMLFSAFRARIVAAVVILTAVLVFSLSWLTAHLIT
ncbi:permease [Paenibacillus sp. CCS19]|uniref:permease n=1 Tax=Paenibacillus sp. CCS19 TaxID=3158387 RepID=UPI002561A566|nr:permease [Paenibacillus cellulosilyticus]GMK39854.1 permease [Paenibacillus cellulosilyticus]